MPGAALARRSVLRRSLQQSSSLPSSPNEVPGRPRRAALSSPGCAEKEREIREAVRTEDMAVNPEDEMTLLDSSSFGEPKRPI